MWWCTFSQFYFSVSDVHTDDRSLPTGWHSGWTHRFAIAMFPVVRFWLQQAFGPYLWHLYFGRALHNKFVECRIMSYQDSGSCFGFAGYIRLCRNAGILPTGLLLVLGRGHCCFCCSFPAPVLYTTACTWGNYVGFYVEVGGINCEYIGNKIWSEKKHRLSTLRSGW